MSEQTQNPETETQAGPNPMDELTSLKARADQIGMKYRPNIGVDKLRAKVNARLTGMIDTDADEEDEVEDQTDAALQAVAPETPVTTVRAKTKAEKAQDFRNAVVKDAMALVRCKIYNLDPRKRDLKGEIITVANKFIGKVTKFIPFGEETEGGYHIPKVIYDDLVARRFLDLRSKEVNGKTVVTRREVPEYNIIVLPQLTQEELQELAIRQQAAQRLGA